MKCLNYLGREGATDESSEYWTREKVSFDTVSGDQRVPVYLFLPKQFEPPYQPVVFFPGSGVFGAPDSSDELQLGFWDFLVRDGRALVWPIYEVPSSAGPNRVSP